MRGLFVIATVALCTGCYPEIDIEPVPADYRDWYRIDTYGPAPGHGNTYRIIYANPDATVRVSEGGGLYVPGTIIVKEVRELIDGDQPGDINYIAVMRKIMDRDTPDGAELAKTVPNNPSHDFGWLFTYANAALTSEEYRSSCWDSCHRAAPIDATFIDYAFGYEEP